MHVKLTLVVPSIVAPVYLFAFKRSLKYLIGSSHRSDRTRLSIIVSHIVNSHDYG